MREIDKVRGRITQDVATARIGTITTPIFVQGRNSDELQGIFRVCYDLLVEVGKPAQWATYEHDVHGFVYVQRNPAGAYAARCGAAPGGAGLHCVLRRPYEEVLTRTGRFTKLYMADTPRKTAVLA